MPVKRRTPEDVYGEWYPQDLRDMAKAKNGLNLGPSGPPQALRSPRLCGAHGNRGRMLWPLETHQPMYSADGNLPTMGRRATSPHKG
jgi:hypothetical protein